MKHFYPFVLLLTISLTASAQLQVSGELQKYSVTSSIKITNAQQLESAYFETQTNAFDSESHVTNNPLIDNSSLITAVLVGDKAQNTESSLSIKNQPENKIKLFPNPATGASVTIVSKQNLAVEVFDILGKKVSSQKITRDQRKLNISNLKSGIYLVKLHSEEGTETRKLIIR